ncbi:MAG: hypothetical protein ACYTEU_05845 [Planctomycetota bacterium]|jgi:hypothetical protein
MTVGLPGTGIGGLFYILLSCIMPFLHLFRMLRGTHKLHHLKTWILSIFLSAGIILSLYGEAKVFVWFAEKIDSAPIKVGQSLALNDPSLTEGSVLAAISPALVLLPFIVLFTLLIGVQILRFVVHGCQPSEKVIQLETDNMKLQEKQIA